MVDYTVGAGIGVLQMDHPPVNALDVEFLRAVAGGLAEAEKSEARAVIITGTDAAFSAGADLFSVLEGGRDYVESAFEPAGAAFEGIFRFPKPLVAAVNGHAIAGGCVLACACDYRVAADGDFRIGLAELRVGVTFPSWALETVRFAVPSHRLQELIYLARTYGPRDALERGLVDEVVEPAGLMDRAREVATSLSQIPESTFRLTKEALRRPFVERAQRTGPADDERGREIWSSEEVHDSIRAFLRKTLGTDVRPGS